ncbi:hypothetical protein DACRYDRAFT_119183 [Dacryopinax primogenitus]|uniref:Uncharacterized protein n=1 Tax=Dacryopinax primogenitus (strain DJM 731) TaxID=1858805 RepID=M5FVU1_DACPD|nr:uncharacterized protein DACRYDRAFT_119183 [Dacryopinax primogenitus]EJT97481.1 hypothetical protein DACRYDRAFT_119183 [Dacryopinax primogenitus]
MSNSAGPDYWKQEVDPNPRDRANGPLKGPFSASPRFSRFRPPPTASIAAPMDEIGSPPSRLPGLPRSASAEKETREERPIADDGSDVELAACLRVQFPRPASPNPKTRPYPNPDRRLDRRNRRVLAHASAPRAVRREGLSAATRSALAHVGDPFLSQHERSSFLSRTWLPFLPQAGCAHREERGCIGSVPFGTVQIAISA